MGRTQQNFLDINKTLSSNQSECISIFNTLHGDNDRGFQYVKSFRSLVNTVLGSFEQGSEVMNSVETESNKLVLVAKRTLGTYLLQLQEYYADSLQKDILALTTDLELKYLSH